MQFSMIVLFALQFISVSAWSQGRLLPLEKPISISNLDHAHQEPSFHLAVDFWIGENGIHVTGLRIINKQKVTTYSKDYWVEFESNTGKKIRVRASNPAFGPKHNLGSSVAVIPTEESGRGISVWSPEGTLLGTHYPGPQPEPSWIFEGTNRGKAEFSVTGDTKHSIQYRTSWDDGLTWEQIKPLNRDLNIKSNNNRIRINLDRITKASHPLVEVFYTSGLTVFRKIFMYQE